MYERKRQSVARWEGSIKLRASGLCVLVCICVWVCARLCVSASVRLNVGVRARNRVWVRLNTLHRFRCVFQSQLCRISFSSFIK